MNFFRSNVGTLNEILFEKKNKLYGAYAIRVAYGGTVFKSLGITAAIMIGGVWLLSLAMRVEDELVIKNDDSQLTDSVIIFDGTPPTKVDPPVTPPNAHPPAGGSTSSVITQIIDHGADTTRDVTLNTNIEPTNPGPPAGPPSTATTTATYTPSVPPTPTVTTSDPPTDFPDSYPDFPGLKKFWADNIRYPEGAQQGNIEGKVWVNFVVDEKGKVINCKVIKKLGYGCDEEVLRVMKLMPHWKPGYKNGQPVKVNLNQPIEFRLQ